MLIPQPRFSDGHYVHILKKTGNLNTPQCVKILGTSILVEEQEIYYKVQEEEDAKKQFVINEDEILHGVGSVPMPAFSIGDNVHFNVVSFLEKDPDSPIWDVFQGVIDEVLIKFTESGYTIMYHTDEHVIGDYCLEEDIIDIDIEDEEEEREVSKVI